MMIKLAFYLRITDPNHRIVKMIKDDHEFNFILKIASFMLTHELVDDFYRRHPGEYTEFLNKVGLDNI